MTIFDKMLKEYIEKEIEDKCSKTPRFNLICNLSSICINCPIKKGCDKHTPDEIENILKEECNEL